MPDTAELHVRLATAAQLDEAGTVVRLAYLADGFARDAYLDTLSNARDRALDAEVAVAMEADGTVVGSVTFALPGSRWSEMATPGEAEFRMLGVAATARGRGAGGALVDWCIARAIQAGAHRVVISSERAMSAAHRLYLRRGFLRTPELDWSPAPGIDLLGFALDLPR